MKKVHFLSAAAASLLFASCYTTHGVFSESLYQDMQNTIQANMESHGYNLSGRNSEQKNEVVVTGRSYSKYTGFGTLMDNDFYQHDTYQFTNKEGDNAEYSVKYKLVEDDNNNPAFWEAQVIGCKTSKASDYVDLCTGKYSPQELFSKMVPDSQKSVLDVGATALAITGVSVTLLGAFIIYLIMLP